MATHWPPSPQVEDEELALKHEISPRAQIVNKGAEDEARSRGTVDQYPIILDVKHDAVPNRRHTSSADHEADSIRTQSSDESFGPPTPTFSKTDDPYNPSLRPYRSKPPSPSSLDASRTCPRRGNGGANQSEPRGRPDVPPIHTDIGSDVQSMATGRRRAPSPYSYTKSNGASRHEDGNPSSSSTFLSPDDIPPSQSFSTPYRSKSYSSVRPRSRSRARTDAADYDPDQGRAYHHSRRRSARQASPDSVASANDTPGELRPVHRRSSSYAFVAADLRRPSGRDAPFVPTSRHLQEPRQRPSKDGDEPSKMQSETCGDRRPSTTSCGKNASKDSPYTSSADDERSSRRRGSFCASEEQSSCQPIKAKKDRPYLDLSSHKNAYYNGLPSAAIGGESSSRKGRMSTAGSPWRSPPCSPPTASHGDRRTADYFGKGASAPLPPVDNVRPPSGPSYGDPSAPPVTGVGHAAPSSQPAAAPMRTTSFSADMHPGAEAAWPAKARKSRNSSPVSTHRESLLWHDRDLDRGQPLPGRDDAWSASRGSVRAGPFAPHPPHTAAADLFHARLPSHAPSSVHRPQMNQRATSYSTTDGWSSHQPSSVRSAPLHVGATAGPYPSPLAKTSGLPPTPACQDRVPRQMPLAELPPCPRSVPVAGFYDWYTVVGMSQLDICPACMSVLGASPFQDMFVRSTWAVEGQRILCDFSRPWIRNAWAQIIKQRRNSLEMIYQVVRNSESTKPCPGKGSDIRAWYRLPDPATGAYVPNFDACSECVRSVEIILPQLRGVFKRSGSLVQERTCDLNTHSRRFEGYLRLLDAAALQYDVERLKEPDMQPFADHARKTARVRECSRDDMVLDQVWHFIPSLPQFTICEECFEHVVWPVADQPVARSVNRTLQLVPGAQRHVGLSCQLYSERMRQVFFDAVHHADFEYLKQVALRRHGMELALQDKHKALIHDMSMGIDRTTELQTNIEEWRKWE